MKRKCFIASLPFALLSMKNLAAQTTYEKGEKMLIVYYSWSGNTRYAANIIKDILKCDILEVLPEKPYPSDYNETVAIAKKEADAEFKPKIKTKISNLQEYGTIILGSPNWWGSIASPIRTFLAENDMSGKKLVPFMTHEGSRMGRSIKEVKKLCPKSEILDALPIRGGSVKGSKAEIEKWLRLNGLLGK